ncbi:FecR family protein [Sphingobacterium sp. JB170]|uniref:FecR family protein n=1 Tax=Sphingobacterium sp. JB170 TaxID=1434842 RepID=UPI00097F169A|nr:FecR family protein [Sphingobacterium sp. JB170]SJN47002.1 putative anti-sigma factor [Sphingobacterium sp. JB170]
MEKRALKDLLKRYRENKCTEEERAYIESWYNKDIKDEITISEQEIEHDIQAIREQLPVPVRRPAIAWRGYAAAAAVAIICGLFIYIRNVPDAKNLSSKSVVVTASDVMPGSNKATLTLADGSEVLLDDQAVGTIAQQAEQMVYKTEDGQIVYQSGEQQTDLSKPSFNTITTPRGGQYHVTLPDGTKVWINAASSLRYNTSNVAGERLVELKGEGYFEVAPDADRPFKVITDNQVVEVLGTHFNINSYNDEPSTKTTLLEGSVKILEKKTKRTAVLKPGQQASLGKNNKLMVKNVAAGDAVAWKDGLFRFNHSDIEIVMRQMSRWYDVEVEFEGEEPAIKLWGEVYRNVNASQALEILTYFNLKYRIETKDGVKKIIIHS